MPGVDENLAVWSAGWDWSNEGDEWSSWWGGTAALWHGALLPRIHAFVPTGTILELAPGYGRWTQYLKDLCDRLVLVDLAENCIEHCRRRYASSTTIEYHVNDGRSLDMVATGSIDLAFSFDSLVHVDDEVLVGYARQLDRILAPDGVAFLHHSNAGRHRTVGALARRVPRRLLDPLVARGVLLDLAAWRSPTMTADRFAEACDAAGLSCTAQETICWERGYYLLDALSTVTRKRSRWDRDRVVVANPFFRREATRMASLYARSSFPRADDPDR